MIRAVGHKWIKQLTTLSTAVKTVGANAVEYE